MTQKIETIIFDLGGVLIDWDPMYVYKEVFNGDIKKAEWFLNNICTSEWNIKQDAGNLMATATEELVAQHPQYETLIRMFYDRWTDMLKGDIPETVTVLKALKATNKYRIYALTNWSAESFPIARKRFDFLKLFEGILVSGEEKMIKPEPRIYHLMFKRFNINPKKTVFIDDNLSNIKAAKAVGLNVVHYKNINSLIANLNKFGIVF